MSEAEATGRGRGGGGGAKRGRGGGAIHDDDVLPVAKADGGGSWPALWFGLVGWLVFFFCFRFCCRPQSNSAVFFFGLIDSFELVLGEQQNKNESNKMKSEPAAPFEEGKPRRWKKKSIRTNADDRVASLR